MFSKMALHATMVVVMSRCVCAAESQTVAEQDIESCFAKVAKAWLSKGSLVDPEGGKPSIEQSRMWTLSLSFLDGASESSEVPATMSGRGIRMSTVECLEVSGRALTKDDWARLHRLSSVRAVRFSDGFPLQIVDFQMLAQFRELEDLGLNGIRIGIDEVRKLQNCSRLIALRIGRVVPERLGRQRFPTRNSCQLNAEAVDELLKFRGLTYLNLSGIPLTDEQVAQISISDSLEELDVRGCGVNDQRLAMLDSSRRLRTLWLRDQKLPSDERDGFEHYLCEVTPQGALDFEHQHPRCQVHYFYDRLVESTGTLAKLEQVLSPGLMRKKNGRVELRLDSWKVTDEGMTWIARMSDISDLNIATCPVTDAGIVPLRKMESLRALSINGTMISVAGLKEMKSLPHLEELSIDAAMFELKDVRDALKSFPRLKKIVVWVNKSQLEELAKHSASFTEQRVLLLAIPEMRESR